MTMYNIFDEIKASARRKILYLPHAIRQMSRPDRMISPMDVRDVIENGEIIEVYPADQRGHSCLMFRQKVTGYPIHVVCAPKEDYLAIITAYIPSLDEWDADFKKRKRI
ncbi:MAG: DUF4258 domain-containing protein [Deltaproteobacteria bacterium]|nr:DUF4258 domain-containing protein [Deltaproteobacteria bacterium]